MAWSGRGRRERQEMRKRGREREWRDRERGEGGREGEREEREWRERGREREEERSSILKLDAPESVTPAVIDPSYPKVLAPPPPSSRDNPFDDLNLCL